MHAPPQRVYMHASAYPTSIHSLLVSSPALRGVWRGGRNQGALSRLATLYVAEAEVILPQAIQFAVTKLFGTGSQVPLLLVIDAI
jgi:hypothetical protein